MVLLNSFLVATSLLLAARAQTGLPTVTVGETTITGQYDATNDVDAFLGVRYASMKRFERAVLVDYRKKEQVNATVHAPACVQINNATGYDKYGIEEDCGFLEIYRPHNTKKEERLPVMVWIHGGGNNYGAANYYEAYKLVHEAKSINLPVIVVTLNYRLAIWGWPGGKEAAANKVQNLGLYDQRTALEWVQRHIGAFGGDKDKVILFGESAGSMSTQFLYLDEKSDLFRGVIMQSGGVNSVPAIPAEMFQDNYDAFIAAIGCQDAEDTFTCLKEADLTTVANTVNVFVAAPQKYSPRPWNYAIDGEIIHGNPAVLLAQGKFSKKPFIHGDVLDEGTFFPKPTPIETEEAMWDFFKVDNLGKGVSFLTNQTTLDKLSELYPADPEFGSPYNTGTETYGLGANFKRAAALFGDIRYQAPRRSFLNDALKAGVKGWTYQLSQFTPSPYPAAYGVFHSVDLFYVFMMLSETDTEHYKLAKQIVSYWVSFAHHLDPNHHPGNPEWPTYDKPNGNLLEFMANKTSVIPDTYRNEAISFINSIPEQFGASRN